MRPASHSSVRGRLAAVERMNDVRKSRKRVFAVTFADETTRDRYAQAHPDARKQGAASVEAAVAGNPDAFVKDLAAYDIVDLAAREQRWKSCSCTCTARRTRWRRSSHE